MKYLLQSLSLLILAVLLMNCGGGASSTSSSSNATGTTLTAASLGPIVDAESIPSASTSGGITEAKAAIWRERAGYPGADLAAQTWYMEYFFLPSIADVEHPCTRETGGYWRDALGTALPTNNGRAMVIDRIGTIESTENFTFVCGDEVIANVQMFDNPTEPNSQLIFFDAVGLPEGVVLDMPEQYANLGTGILFRFHTATNEQDQTQIYPVMHGRINLNMHPDDYMRWLHEPVFSVYVAFQDTGITTFYNLSFTEFSIAPAPQPPTD